MRKIRQSMMASIRVDNESERNAICLLKLNAFSRKMMRLRRCSAFSLMSGKLMMKSVLYRWNYNTAEKMISDLDNDSNQLLEEHKQIEEAVKKAHHHKLTAVRSIHRTFSNAINKRNNSFFELFEKNTKIIDIGLKGISVHFLRLFSNLLKSNFNNLTSRSLHSNIKKLNDSLSNMNSTGQSVKKQINLIATQDSKSVKKLKTHIIRNMLLVWNFPIVKAWCSLVRTRPEVILKSNTRKYRLIRVMSIVKESHLCRVSNGFHMIISLAQRRKQREEVFMGKLKRNKLRSVLQSMRITCKSVRRSVLLFRRLHMQKVMRDMSDALWVLRSNSVGVKTSELIDLIGYASEGVSETSQELSRITQENFRMQVKAEKRGKRRNNGLMKAVFTRIVSSFALRNAVFFQKLSYHCNHSRKAEVGFGLLSRIYFKALGFPFRRICRSAVVEREKFLSSQIKEFRETKEDLEQEREELNTQVLAFIEEKTVFEASVPTRVSRLKTSRTKLTEKLVAKGIHRKCEIAIIKLYLEKWKSKKRRNDILKELLGDNTINSSEYYFKKWKKKASSINLKNKSLNKMYSFVARKELNGMKMGVMLILDKSIRKEEAQLIQIQEQIDKKIRKVVEAKKRDNMGFLVSTITGIFAKKPFIQYDLFFSNILHNYRTWKTADLRVKGIRSAHTREMLSKYFAKYRYEFSVSQSEKKLKKRHNERSLTFIFSLLKTNVHLQRQERQRLKTFVHVIKKFALRRCLAFFLNISNENTVEKLETAPLVVRLVENAVNRINRSSFLFIKGDMPNYIDAAKIVRAVGRVENRIKLDSFRSILRNAKCEAVNAHVVSNIFQNGRRSKEENAILKRRLGKFKSALRRLEESLPTSSEIMRAWLRETYKSKGCLKLFKLVEQKMAKPTGAANLFERWKMGNRPLPGAADFLPADEKTEGKALGREYMRIKRILSSQSAELSSLREEAAREEQVCERTRQMKVKVFKNVLRRLVSKRANRLARQSMNEWYEAVYIIRASDRFRIPEVDTTLRACQQILYNQTHETGVLQDRIIGMNDNVEAGDEMRFEVMRARDERKRTEQMVAAKTRELHELMRQEEALVKDVRNLQHECRELIEGGLYCFENDGEDDVEYSHGTTRYE